MKTANALFATITLGAILAIGPTTASMARSESGTHSDGRGEERSGMSNEMSGRVGDRDAGRHSEPENEFERTADEGERDRNHDFRPGNDDSWGDISYCQSLYRSYDSVSRTFLAHDGHRHSCP